MRIPYPINGTVKDVNDTTIVDATVDIINLRTGEKISVQTDNNGVYTIDLANMQKEYGDNDPVLVRAYVDAEPFKFNEARITINTSTGSSTQDLTLKVENPEPPKDRRDYDKLEHHPAYNAKRSLLYGVDSSDNVHPIKVVDDGSGYGKLVCKVE